MCQSRVQIQVHDCAHGGQHVLHRNRRHGPRWRQGERARGGVPGGLDEGRARGHVARGERQHVARCVAVAAGAGRGDRGCCLRHPRVVDVGHGLRGRDDDT